jgi:uncharacterized protein (TIGR03084 family)
VAIFDDLEAEQDRLQDILAGLDDAQWLAPSGAAGWSVADVVLHLAQSEESVVASAAGNSPGSRPDPGMNVDQVMEYLVSSQRAAPDVVFARWRTARLGALEALRAADPQQPLPWVDAPLKPATMATTRLAEHWAHGLDITGPLDIDFPDTERLRHVAWLAHRSLPYAFMVAGEQPRDVYCELTAPDGAESWPLGPADAESAIMGSAGAFCRVAAQRTAAGESGLEVRGPHAALALTLLRTYAA